MKNIVYFDPKSWASHIGCEEHRIWKKRPEWSVPLPYPTCGHSLSRPSSIYILRKREQN